MSVKSVFLNSGEAFLAKEGESIQTTLGSCVSLCVHDRALKIGGMIHFLLPTLPTETTESNPLKYGNYAVRHLLQEFKKLGSVPKNLEIAILGGLFNNPDSHASNSTANGIAQGNVEVAEQELQRLGLSAAKRVVNVMAKSLQVRFHSATGEIEINLHKDEPVCNTVVSLPKNDFCRLIAMGASTGGTDALRDVFKMIPADCAPIVIVQHMPEKFTKEFADHLNKISPVQVKEAEHGDVPMRGHAYLAPGGKQMRVAEKRPGEFMIEVLDAPPVNRFQPSVDYLFLSLAALKSAPYMRAAILTGMGEDGARGILQLKQKGAWTVAQDEKTCVVFGMPKAAIELNGVHTVLPLLQIAPALLNSRASRQPKPAKSG